MKCAEFEGMIYDYIDNALQDDSKRAFEAHIAECGECKKSFENAKSVLSALSDMASIEPPEDFTARVMERVAPRRAIVIPMWKRFCAAAAAVFVCVIGVSVFFNNAPRDAGGDENANVRMALTAGGIDEDAAEKTTIEIESAYKKSDAMPALAGNNATEAIEALKEAKIPFNAQYGGEDYIIKFIEGAENNDSPSE